MQTVFYMGSLPKFPDADKTHVIFKQNGDVLVRSYRPATELFEEDKAIREKLGHVMVSKTGASGLDLIVQWQLP